MLVHNLAIVSVGVVGMRRVVEFQPEAAVRDFISKFLQDENELHDSTIQ